MKSLKQIESEIAMFERIGNDGNKRDRSNAINNLAFLRSVKLYMETNPRPEYIRQQLSETEFKIKKIESDAETWIKGRSGDANKARTMYFKTTQIVRLKQYRNTLRYICDDIHIGGDLTK